MNKEESSQTMKDSKFDKSEQKHELKFDTDLKMNSEKSIELDDIVQNDLAKEEKKENFINFTENEINVTDSIVLMNPKLELNKEEEKKMENSAPNKQFEEIKEILEKKTKEILDNAKKVLNPLSQKENSSNLVNQKDEQAIEAKNKFIQDIEQIEKEIKFQNISSWEKNALNSKEDSKSFTSNNYNEEKPSQLSQEVTLENSFKIPPPDDKDEIQNKRGIKVKGRDEDEEELKEKYLKECQKIEKEDNKILLIEKYIEYSKSFTQLSIKKYFKKESIQLLMKVHKFEEAIIQCDDYINNLDSLDPSILLLKAKCFIVLDQIEQGVDCLDLVLNLDPTNQDAKSLMKEYRVN